MGILDGVGDALGGVAGGIGKVADFLTPQTDRRGAGWSFGDLVNDVVDVGKNSFLGAVDQVDDVLLSDDVSGATKLFTAGMIGLGGAGYLGGRHLAATRKMERTAQVVEGVLPAATRWTPEMGELGLVSRSNLPATPESQMLFRQHPGLLPRQADVLSASDEIQTAVALNPALADNVEGLGRTSAFIAAHADRLQHLPPEGRLGAAQMDFSKLDTAVEHGIISADAKGLKGKGPLAVNAEFRRLWSEFIAGTLEPGSEDGLRFSQMASQFSDATDDIIDPDMTFGMVGKVVGLDFTEAGIVMRAKLPLDWDEHGPFVDSKVRAERIRELNLRPLASQGKEYMRQLYKDGVEDQRRRAAGEAPVLPRPLAKGSGWYRQAHDDIVQAHAELPEELREWVTHEKLTAAVSLTSEAEKWEGNIALATSVLTRSGTDKMVADEGFQAWLRDGMPAVKDDTPPADAERLRRYSEHFDAMHTEAKKGNQLDRNTFAKVLRLRNESAASVFASTSGKKQKNFHLNLIDPDSTGPITIDRHMHDVFLGLASGSDFKLLEGGSLSDSNYDIIADTLRELADELGVPPNEIQGVVWESWKARKESHRALGSAWASRDPFRMRGPNGEENPVFEAIQGRFPVDIQAAITRPGRLTIVNPDGKSKGLVILPEQTLGAYGPKDESTARAFRHMYPAIDANGVSMWAHSAPATVRDLEQLVRTVDRELVGHRTDVWSAVAWPNGHPATWAEDVVMVEMPDGVKAPSKYGPVVDPRVPAMTGRPGRSSERLSLADLVNDPGRLADPERSPLLTHDWIGIEAAANPLTGETAGTLDDLVADLQAAGYHPIRQRGFYKYVNADGTPGLDESDSLLVFGMPVSEGLRWGRKYKQDSIAAPGGLFYSDGTMVPGEGITFGSDFSEGGGSSVQLAGEKVDYGVAKLRWPEDGEERVLAYDEVDRVRTRSRQVAVKIRSLSDLDALRDELAKRGGKVSGIYSSQPPSRDYVRAREYLYSDGITIAGVRTRDAEFEAPNGYHVWVPRSEADGLPKKTTISQRWVKDPKVAMPAENVLIVNNMVVVQGAKDLKAALRSDMAIVGSQVRVVPKGATDVPGQLVTRRDGRFVIDADPNDMRLAAEAANVLGQLGVKPDQILIMAGSDTAELSNVVVRAERGKMTTILGREVDAIRTSSTPMPEWKTKYGVWYDPGYRTKSGKIEYLPPEFATQVGHVIDKVMSEHQEAATLMGFRKIGVNTDLSGTNTVAQFAWGRDGAEIQLNPDVFSSPEKIRASRTVDIQERFLSPALPADASGTIAHEFGHMLHQALIRSFESKKLYEKTFEKQLTRYFKAVGAVDIAEGLSGYAATDLQEFVAEAVAEAMFAPHPRKIARDVYTMVVDEYRSNMSRRAPTNWEQ